MLELALIEGVKSYRKHSSLQEGSLGQLKEEVEMMHRYEEVRAP